MNDVRSSISISRNSGVGKLISKIPRGMREAFVKVISNPIVEGVTFATVAYQFGHNIDAIVKGDHHPLNYYFATSGGIKLASMSMKPISMGVRAAVKGLGVTTKALKAVSAISSVLGKLSMATAVIDSAVTISITIYETTEYVKAIAGKIPLSDIEQVTLSLDRILREFSPLYLVIQGIAGNKPLGQHYENKNQKSNYKNQIIKIKSYLDHIKKVAKEMLMKKPEQVARPGQCSIYGGIAEAVQLSVSSIVEGYNDPYKDIAGVVQYVSSIVEEYSKIIKSDRSHKSPQPECTTDLYCIGVSYGKINNLEKDLSSLNISRTQRLIPDRLSGKTVYRAEEYDRRFPYITSDERENGLTISQMPTTLHEGNLKCGSVINEEVKSHRWPRKCNDGKVYRNCTITFTLSGGPFIFPNERASILSPILYLSVPTHFEVSQNRPAIVYLPEGGIVFHGSKNHDNVFIVGDNTSGFIFGGEENNAIVMNYNTSDIFAGLCDGIINMAGSKITLMDILSGYIYNYISHSTANQNITTGCKTRYVDAGEGGGSNFIQHHDVNCQDEDYEVRKVRKNDTHFRSIKRTIFIVDESSDSGASIRFNNLESKKNLDIISIENIDIARLRINEYQTGYRLDILDCGEQGTIVSVEIDSFEKLVIQLKKVGITKTIIVQNKSLSDIIGDMAYQIKLNHSGTYVNRKIMDNSKKRSKAVIIADITGSENTTAYVFAKKIADSSKNLGIIVSQIELIKGDITLHYAVNNINQIKLILNNSTGISAGERENYNSLLFEAIKNGNLNDVKDLLDKGAEIEAEKSGFTALTCSLHCKKDDIVYFLLEMGADVNNRGKNNIWPLELAVHLGDLNLVKELVTKGANIRAKNKEGKTPLDIATENGKTEVANFLRAKQSEGRAQRKRRHHHGDHPHHHSGEQKHLQREERSVRLEPKGASRSIENDNSAIESNQATSGASKPSSWANAFDHIVDAVKGIFQLISSPFKPAIDMEHSQSSKAMTTQSIDTNGTLLLLDVFIRKVTGQKYISSNTRGITEQEASGYALSVTEKFRKVVEQAALKSGISIHRLNIDFMEIQKEITKKVIGGKFNEIPEVLSSYVEKACSSREAGKLSPKKFDKFMIEFNKRLDLIVNQSMQQILNNRESTLEVNDVKEQQISLEPKSYLSDTSVQGHLTQDRGLRNQGKALIP